MNLSTIIVDSDAIARERLRKLLLAYPDFKIVGECQDGEEAIKMAKALNPLVLFIDVDIPKTNGIDVLKELSPDVVPITVYVTSDPTYAIHAFEVQAADYMMKPVSESRMAKSIERIKALVGLYGMHSNDTVRVQEEIREDVSGQGLLNRIMIKSNGRVNLVKVEDIDWIEASGNYLRLHVGEKVHLIRDTMASMEQKLHSDQFMRIHRSTIVNIDRIKEMQPWFHGEYEVLLHNGKRLSMSRGYKDKLKGFVKK